MVIGTTIMFFLFIFLMGLGIIITPITEVEEFTVAFIFWSIISSFITYHFKFLKKKVPTLLKALGLFLLFIFINVYDENAGKVENYFTLFLVTVWFSTLVYVLTPPFFKKYSKYFYGAYIGFSLYNGVFVNEADKFENMTVILGLSIPVLFMLWVYEQWKWVKMLKNEKSRAELQLLKSQINPHFFFNTLNNLYGLTVEKSDKAPEVVLKLGDMMRYTIYEGKEEQVNIQDEIQYLENYIELHKIRYQKNVQVHFINSVITDFKIAPLLYIILLENAFKHGVETLVEDAYIFIEIEEIGNSVTFSIENNYDRVMIDERVGIGVDNLKKRLNLLYPNKYVYQIEEGIDTYKVQLTIDFS